MQQKKIQQYILLYILHKYKSNEKKSFLLNVVSEHVDTLII